LFHAGNALGVSLSKEFPSQPGPANSSLQDYPLGVSPTHPQQLNWNAWRLVHVNLSAYSPNHSSPSGSCSGCESVPWEDCYIRNPTADSFLSLSASPGYYPLQTATFRVTCSLMRFARKTALNPPSKLGQPRVEKQGALQRFNHPGWNPTLASEISPPEVLRPSSTLNPKTRALPTQCASGQITRSSPGTCLHTPGAS
jgi:hypothetical protein